ncbi:MAG: hypothetical protein ACXWV5_06285 [Flavitalea sp.]
MNRDQIDLDQNVTNRPLPVDSVFLNFERDWKKFISPTQVFLLPIMKEQEETWEPLVFSDCSFVAEAKRNIPQVEIAWNSPPMQSAVRFDIALHYQGFEKNYYTSVLIGDTQTRFNIPGNSSFVKDTAAVILTGPALFPKVLNFAQQTSASNPAAINQASQQVNMVRNVLRLSDLGPGLSYRIRMCNMVGEQWTPTREVIVTTPICPTDYK